MATIPANVLALGMFHAQAVEGRRFQCRETPLPELEASPEAREIAQTAEIDVLTHVNNRITQARDKKLPECPKPGTRHVHKRANGYGCTWSTISNTTQPRLSGKHYSRLRP